MEKKGYTSVALHSSCSARSEKNVHRLKEVRGSKFCAKILDERRNSRQKEKKDVNRRTKM
jgi:hypothetical protein